MDSPKSPEEIILKKDQRIEFLEKQGRWQLFCFELLTSLGELNHDAGISRDVHRLFSVTQEYLFKIVQFEKVAFYTINEEDSDFTMAECFPEEARGSFSHEIDSQIENGTFAWAVHQNKPVLVGAKDDDHTLLLHVLATKRRVRGMFAGIFKGRKEFLDENLEFPLSLVLQNTANALEGMHLYELVFREKMDLEQRIQSRTHELEEKALRLQEELGFRKLAEEKLQQTTEQLEHALKSKNEFFTNISHEFRTPLNAILGFSELLMVETQKINRNDMKEDLETVISAANHLLTLINDILDMSVIRTGAIEVNWENTDPEPLIKSILPLVEPLARKNQNRISCDIKEKLDHILVDSTRFRQILLNLLGNACKFTDNGSIFLSARHEKDSDGKWLVVQVADTGPGIDQKNLNSIFDDFQQGNLPLNRKRSGTGLGLSISRNLARIMGGDLTVTSEKGLGAKFTLKLPCGKEASRELAGRTPGEPTLRTDTVVEENLSDENTEISREILRDYDLAVVADQSAVTCNLLANFLEKEGFQVQALSNSEDFLHHARKTIPEMIVLGSLPDKHASEISLSLLEDPDTSGVPVILLDDELKDTPAAKNICAVLGKPIEWDRLSKLSQEFKKRKNLPTVLLLENDPLSGDLLKRVLSRNGWKVRLEIPGGSTMDDIRKDVPDIILLIPSNTNGGGMESELAEQLGHDPLTENVPLVVFRSQSDEMDKQSIEKIKAVAWVEKGKCTRDELMAVLNHSLRKFRETTPG